MGLLYTQQTRAERLIATGRLILAAFSLLAIWLDPSQPAKHAEATYTLLSAYVIYAGLLTVWAWRLPLQVARLSFITHGGDLGIFFLFMYLTEGPSSPFFVYFVFSLVCATVRWQWRGTFWTAVGAIAAFIGLGVYAAEVVRDPAFELNRFVIRSVYLVVLAILLGYLGAYEERRRGELSKLAAWPLAIPEDVHALVREVLEHAATILGAPRALMVWEEPEEPWLHLASWFGGKFQWQREPPTSYHPLVAEPLSVAAFLCQDTRAELPTVTHKSSEVLKSWRGAPLHPTLQTRFAINTVLSVRLHGESLEGRLFLLDKRGMTPDDLLLGEVIARTVTARLDLYALLHRLKHMAAAEERLRLARDLHDGLLQSLTGAALQLQAATRLLEEEPRAARERLREIQHLIADEQRELRAFIQGLRPTVSASPAPDSSLAIRLHDLGKKIERQWGLPVEFNVEAPEGGLPESLATEIHWITHEALVNVARHAHASAVRMTLTMDDGQVHINVTDNGCGFPFRGYYEHAALAASNLGPVTLKERIESLGGSLAIDSTESGARLEITLPRVRPGVRHAD